MAKSRRSGARSKKPLPKAAQTIGFTETDEAFFRVGDEPAALADTVDDYEERPSLWRRVFSRTQDA